MAKKLLVMVQVLGFFLAAVSVMADSPNGTISIELNSMGTIDNMRVNWVDGVLTFRGKTHPFKVKGLKLNAAGVRTLTAQGEVYNLQVVTDLAGKYQKVDQAGITSIAGQEGLVIRNDKGVVINIRVIKRKLEGKVRTVRDVFKKEVVLLDLVPEGLTIDHVQ
jgi:hypothetical protein